MEVSVWDWDPGSDELIGTTKVFIPSCPIYLITLSPI